jgi:hypothetical protein
MVMIIAVLTVLILAANLTRTFLIHTVAPKNRSRSPLTLSDQRIEYLEPVNHWCHLGTPILFKVYAVGIITPLER